MSNFFKRNEKLLRQNFEKQMAEFGSLGSVADPQSRETMLSNFVREQEQAAKNGQGPYRLMVDSDDGQNQEPGVHFDPDRKTPPPDRPRFVPDYSVPMPKTQVEQPPTKHPNTVTQADIELVRKTNPDEAEIMEELIAMSPHYQKYGDDGNSPELNQLYSDYAKIIGATGMGSATMGVARRTPINPIPELRKYYGPQGPVWGQRKAGAPFTGLANSAPYRIGWTKHGDGSVFRIGLPGNHKGITIPFVRGRSMRPPPKPWE